MLTIPITIFSVIYMFLLAVVYFSKERISTTENKIYSNMIRLSCFGILVDAASSLFVIFNATDLYLFRVATKLMFVYYVLWSGLLLSYTVLVSLKYGKSNVASINRFLKAISWFFIVCSILVICLPLTYYNENGVVYPEGLSVNFTYFIAGFLSIGIMIILLIKNYKHIKSKKFIPIYSLLLMFSLTVVIQNRNPEIIMTTPVECFITFLMYFTIENPDMQMMEELYKNKKLIEKSNEDTSNFLFRMTQDIKKPISDIINISNDMLEIKDTNELKEGSTIINNKAKELDYFVNDVLDVSLMDTKNLKFFDNRYNVANLCKEVAYQAQSELSDNVKFEYSVSNNLPQYLYGDSIRLKKIIYSALDNSIKNTSSGFISMEVNSIIKYDICRLIINIADSGSGISIDTVNDILSLNIDDLASVDISDEKSVFNLKEIKKLVMVLGGNLVLKSEIDKGTTISITIDQKIVKLENDEVLRKLDLYEESLQSNKRVMVVDDDAKELSKITNFLEKRDVTVNGSLFGRDLINKISAKHKFDFIILDDETNTISAYEVLKELKKNDKFNIPVIIMIDDQKEFIKLHFLKDGFSDVIMKSKLESELDRILKRF